MEGEPPTCTKLFASVAIRTYSIFNCMCLNRLAGLGKNGRPGRKLDLCFFYLDDGVLAGSIEAASEALEIL